MLHSKRWSGSGASNAYESVSTQAPGHSESRYAANKFPKEAARWQCGEQRLALRQKFNTKEIDTAKVMSRYDVDRSRVLEQQELRQLLQDFNQGAPVKDDDLAFVFRVADRNADRCISQEEVLFALKSWYAFNHMPASVGAAFGRHRVGDGPMPTVEVINEMLLMINDAQPVGREEASWVRQTALALGGTDDWVSQKQMRQAVATWYLHIERGETTSVELLQHSAQDAHEKITEAVGVKSWCSGELDFRARGTQILLIVFMCLFGLMPGLEILTANLVPSTIVCEHPHLSKLLWVTGLLGLFQAVALVCLAAASCRPSAPLRIVAVTFTGTMTSILIGVGIIGISEVLTSTAGNCGFTLWHFCHFVYLQLPVLALLFFCVGLPVLYCVLGSTEFFKNRSLDESLMKV